MSRFSGRCRVGWISTMNEEEQVELLSRVEMLKDLPEGEISQVLRDLLRRHAESNLGAGEDFSPRESPTASCSSSSGAGCASTRWKSRASSSWRCWKQAPYSGRSASPPATPRSILAP